MIGLSISAPNHGGGGVNAWTWTPALVIDGNRVVMQIIDWVGGSGTKPDVGVYIGATGFVNNIQDAIDIRGLSGEGGGTSPLTIGQNGELSGFLLLEEDRTSISETIDQTTVSGKSLNFTNDNPISVVVDGANMKKGWNITWTPVGNGQITFSAASGTEIVHPYNHTKSRAKHGSGSLVCKGTFNGLVRMQLNGETSL